MAPDRSRDGSVFEEPHMRPGPHRPDPSERSAERILSRERADEAGPDQRVNHSVWDEPVLSPDLVGAVPQDALTYPRWLAERRGAMGALRSWALTVGMALAAGPWAVLGALLAGSRSSGWAMLYLVVFGPVAEEVMKVALPLVAVEVRPYVFLSRFQILLCALAAGAAFGTIENLIYLHVYVPDPPAWLPPYRWSVCLALHVGCSLVAGLGVVRVWQDVWNRMDRPRLPLAYPYQLTAIVLHGAYNGLAAILTAAGVLAP